MTTYNESDYSLNISPNGIEIIRDYYKEKIEEGLVTNNEGFVVYVLSEHIRSLNCENVAAFNEIVLIPVINQIVRNNSISDEKINAFLKGKILFPGVF
jgi:hypothetical protein